MFKYSLLISASLLIASPMMAFADGASIAKDKCSACHGEDSDGKVPSIAGFSKDGIVEMMMAYQSGDRKSDQYEPEGGKATDMNAVTKDMSAEDIGAVASFYAGKSFKPAAQDSDADLAAKGAKVHEKSCEKCHAEGGKSAEDDTAILAGQRKPYLETEFGKFAAGDRDMPKKMKKKFDGLSDDDKKALLEYYASQK